VTADLTPEPIAAVMPSARRSSDGGPLIPGHNVDLVDMSAGLEKGRQLGFDSPEHQMVVEYALMRHRRGEEDGAMRSALSGGIDLTSWYVIIATAIAAVQAAEAADAHAARHDYLTHLASRFNTELGMYGWNGDDVVDILLAEMGRYGVDVNSRSGGERR
jgi:hypothetical protein